MGREKISFDEGWKFHYGEILSVRNRWGWGKSGSWMQGPESKSYDDSEWRGISLPHDFVSETTPKPYMEREFDGANAILAMEDVNNMHTTAGSFEKGIGWYRKHFYVPKEDEGRKLYLIFDGIFRDSRAFLNDFFIGNERSGYTQIVYDITDTVNYGGDNVLSVRVDASGSEGWFYEGGGIYRHAWLLKTEEQHIEDLYVRCDVKPMEKHAVVHLQVEMAAPAVREEEDKDLYLEIRITDADNREAAGVRKISVGSHPLQADFELDNAVLWDTENPYLYRAAAALYRSADGTKLDELTTAFGIRKIEFDKDKGFFLNGKQTKIKGVCCHQNHGGLGSALPDEVFEYRIRKLKEMGANAYRCSHYPASSVFLDLCDRMGMLVLNENRLLSSEEGDLRQLRSMVRLSRNHPSVFLYSIGNEEAQSQAIPQGGRIARTMVRTIRALDPDTPVTMAMVMWDLKNKVPITDVHALDLVARELDVAGFNYHEEIWQEWHEAHPDQPMICTEQGTFRSTRDCVNTDSEKCHLAITDQTAVSYMSGAGQWHACRRDWMSGLFIWTGFDYYGEPTPYAWPAISSQFGAMDLCGYPKDFYYYYQAWWSGKPVLHVFPSWNGNPGEKRNVYVFTNCSEVELFVNGVSVGRKSVEQDGYLCWEDVIFSPGKLEAVGKGSLIGDALTSSKELHAVLYTEDAPEKIRVTKDFSGKTIQIFKVELTDHLGRRVLNADQLLHFRAAGGKILGVSNGDPSEHAPLHGDQFRTFHGLLQVIVEGDASAAIDVTVQDSGV